MHYHTPSHAGAGFGPTAANTVALEAALVRMGERLAEMERTIEEKVESATGPVAQGVRNLTAMGEVLALCLRWWRKFQPKSRAGTPARGRNHVV